MDSRFQIIHSENNLGFAAAHASYEDLAEAIRTTFTDHSKALTEMFKRLCFNILVSNTDDHARNHAAFWDGRSLELTPAYEFVLKYEPIMR